MTPHRRRFGAVLGRVLVLLLWIAPAAAVEANESAPVDLAAPRDALARWAETRRLIAEEAREWEVARDVLEQRIELVRRETAGLDEQTSEIDAQLGGAGDREAELAREKAALRSLTEVLGEEIDRLEALTRRLLPSLPDPLHRRVEPLVRRLTAEGDAASRGVTLAQRYQAIVGILNEAGKFARDITLVNEVRELPGGQRAELRVLYLGVSQAWYVTADGKAGGIGVPGPGGWEWSSRDGAAPEIARAMAILRDEAVPDYVPLPVIVR